MKPLALLRRLTCSPGLNLSVGLILFASGLAEAIRELAESGSFELGAHHGVAAYGLLTSLKTLPDLFEGAEYVTRGSEFEVEPSADA